MSEGQKPKLLDQLRASNLWTGQGGDNVLADAVLTAVAPFDFQENSLLDTDQFDPGGEGRTIDDFFATVLGVDVHVLDNINLDANNPDPEDDKSATDIDDDLVVFTHRLQIGLHDFGLGRQ